MGTRTLKNISAAFIALAAVFFMAACSDSETASDNLSKDSDNFKIARKIVFYNGITDKHILAIEGFCSIKADMTDKQL